MTPIEQAEAKLVILEHLEELLADLTMGDDEADMSDKEMGEYLDAMMKLGSAILESLSFEIISVNDGTYTVSIKPLDIPTFVDEYTSRPIVK